MKIVGLSINSEPYVTPDYKPIKSNKFDINPELEKYFTADDDLQSLLDDDNISDIEALNQFKKMKEVTRKRKLIKEKYKDKIKYREDKCLFYLYIERKQYFAKSLNELIDIIADLDQDRAQASLVDLYLEYMLWRRDCTATSSKTVKEDSHLWKAFIEPSYVATTPLVELRAKDFIKLFRSWTKDRTLTRKKFNNIKSIINGMYAYAIEQEIVEHNPIKDINYKQFTFKQPENKQDEVFTLDERRKLLDYLSGIDTIYSLGIQLDFQLVARVGELLSLRWSDVGENYIKIHSQMVTDIDIDDDMNLIEYRHVNVDHTKGYAEQGCRYMPLTPDAKVILDKIRKINPDGEFILMKDGKQLLYSSFNRWLERYCLRSGIKPRSSHKIRFCVASMLYVNGVPMTTIQKLLGHSTLAMTLQYLRNVNPDDNLSDIYSTILSS